MTTTTAPVIAALVAMFKAQATEEELSQVIGVFVGPGKKEPEPVAPEPIRHRDAIKRLRGQDGKFIPSRDPERTAKLPAVSIRKMKEFCAEKGIEPIGEAWTMLCDGERRSRVLRAANKRDGITPPDPVDPRVAKLAQAGWSSDEIVRILDGLK